MTELETMRSTICQIRGSQMSRESISRTLTALTLSNKLSLATARFKIKLKPNITIINSNRIINSLQINTERLSNKGRTTLSNIEFYEEFLMVFS